MPGERSDAAVAEVEQLLADLRATDGTVEGTARLVVAREPWRLDTHGPAASLSAALEAALADVSHRRRCAATPPRSLLDGGSALAGGRHPRIGLWSSGWRAARGRRVGRPRPGAAVRNRPHHGRRPVGGRACPLTRGGCAATHPCSTPGCASRRRRPRRSPSPGTSSGATSSGDVVAGDVPLYAGLDTMKLARGVVAEAERRAAALWGADLCRFSVGGSTHGNQAMALAVARPGDRVVVARTLHRSMLLGLVLAGLEPVWLRPDVDTDPRAPARRHGGAPSRRRSATHPTPAPSSSATRPTSARSATCGGLATVAHRHGIPLVVDAAWGAHLGFHPALPPHALAAGRRRPGDQRAQGAAGLVAGRAGAGAQPADRPRPVRRRRRGDRDDQPVGGDPRQHRRRPRPARARRRVAARPGRRGRGDRARAARPGARPGRARRTGRRPDAAHARAHRARVPTATRSRPTSSPAGCRSRWPTATPSSRW